jgi:mRNA interferase MazF
MGMEEQILKRFDIWLIMKNIENGRVIDNLGVCTILSPDELNNFQNLVVAPMTTSSELLPSRIKCMFDDTNGYVMVDQINVVDKVCFIKKLGSLNLDTQVKVCDCLNEFFAL